MNDILRAQASDNTTFVVIAAQCQAVPVDLEPPADHRSHIGELELEPSPSEPWPMRGLRIVERFPPGRRRNDANIQKPVPLVSNVDGGEPISRDLDHDDELRKIWIQRIDDDGPEAAANAIATRVDHLLVRFRIVAHDDELVLISAVDRATRSSGSRERIEVLVPPQLHQDAGLVFARLAQHGIVDLALLLGMQIDPSIFSIVYFIEARTNVELPYFIVRWLHCRGLLKATSNANCALCNKFPRAFPSTPRISSADSTCSW